MLIIVFKKGFGMHFLIYTTISGNVIFGAKSNKQKRPINYPRSVWLECRQALSFHSGQICVVEMLPMNE